jgi:hypothetical protein
LKGTPKQGLKQLSVADIPMVSDAAKELL